MTQTTFDLIVVGGGMVGAALTARLAHSGISIALIEARRPAAFDADQDYGLRVSAISPASQALLQAAGAWSHIHAQRHCPYAQMRIWEQTTKNELHFTAAEVGRDDLGHIIENDLIVDALWQSLGAAQLFCPEQIASLHITNDAAEVTLVDGRCLRAQLLVAADGARSMTRELANIHTFGHSYRQQGIVAVVQTEQPHQAVAWQRFMPSGPLAFLPLDDGRCSIVWSAEDALAEELLALDAAAFCQRLTAASQGRLGQVLATGPRAAFPLQMRQAEAYAQPRLALVGDAAHVVHPLAGQGVNLGFGDVACLAELLEEAKLRQRDLGGYKLLRRYERARKSEDALMAQMMDGLQRLFGSDHALLSKSRGQGLRAVNVLTPLKAAFIHHALGQ